MTPAATAGSWGILAHVTYLALMGIAGLLLAARRIEQRLLR